MTRERRFEFTAKTKLEAWARCKGICEHCGNKIYGGNGPEYHHRYLPATEPGSNTLDNCEVLCARPCHRVKTDKETTPRRAKGKRIIEKRANAKPKTKWPKRPMRSFGAWRD